MACPPGQQINSRFGIQRPVKPRVPQRRTNLDSPIGVNWHGASKHRVLVSVQADAGGSARAPLDDSSRTPSEADEGDGRGGVLKRVRNWVFGGKLDKERLKSLGLGAFISYGFVSNVTYGTVVAIGWASHVSATGLTPFAAGQWQSFLARVAGLLALQQLLRPLRFSCAVALTPLVDRMMGGVQRRLGVKKRTAFFVMLVLLAVVTMACYAAALSTVTVLNMPKAAV